MVRLPTTPGDWRLVGRTLRLVLGIPAYAALAAVLAVAALSVFSFAQNPGFVALALSGSLPLADRFTVLAELYPFVGTSYGLLDGLAVVAVAGLTGVNLALVAYHVREHGLSRRGSGGSAVGVFLGVLGAGCAACGSALLAGLLSLVGAAGLVTALPLEGFEITLLAAGALVLSLYWLAEGMRGGEVRGCPVDPGG